MPARAFRVLADRLQDPLLLVGPRGRVVAANRAAVRELGSTIEGADLPARTSAPTVFLRYLMLAERTARPVPITVTFDRGTTWHADASRAHRRTDEEPLVLLHLRASTSERQVGSCPTAPSAATDRSVAVPPMEALLDRLRREVQRRQELERERASLLTLERRAREHAEEASRHKDELLASVSHELRSPLHAIAGWVALIRQKLDDPELVRRGLDVIERNVVAQTQLTDDLLDVSRAITGRMRLNVCSVDLVVLVRQAIEGARPAAHAKGIALELSTEVEECVIQGDPDRLLQIFWNLLSNATKHTAPKGRIEVELRRGESHVDVVVSDDGQGIAAELLPFVFDRFRQADGAATRRQGGLGLGLAIVRHLVELHGGVAMAHSEGRGQGATFTITLPLPVFRRTSAVNLPAMGSDGGAPGGQLQGVHVLLVEDHDDSRELLESILRSHGAELTATAGPAEARRALRGQTFDVVLSDLEMPDEDGFTLIRKLRVIEQEQGRPRTPAVAVTAHTAPSARVHALRAGFQAFVAKPVDVRELVALIAGLCGAAAPPPGPTPGPMSSSGGSRSPRSRTGVPR